MGGGAYAVGLSDRFAYVAGSDSLFYVVDISIPEGATVSGLVPMEWKGRRVAVDGNWVYVVSSEQAGAYLIDVADPASPQIAGQFITRGVNNGIEIDGGCAYVADGPFFVIGPAHCPAATAGEIRANADRAGSHTTLHVWPNPAGESIEISFNLIEDADSQLSIYDCLGRCVRRYGMGRLTPSPQSLRWDGCDYRGLPLANGTYFALVKTGKQKAAVRFVLFR